MAEEFIFRPAEKKRNKLRLGIGGPSGSGKTLGALFIAKGIIEADFKGDYTKIGLADTENESSNLYADIFPDPKNRFQSFVFNPPHNPERWISLIKSAEKQFDVIILDSATHEWEGAGGCLELNENLSQTRYRGNTWSAWNETTPRHQAFLDAINQSPKHIICTARSKTETVQLEGGKVQKLGMKIQQRPGFEYEMTLMLECEHSSFKAVLTKGRLFSAPESVKQLFINPHKITEQDGRILLEWLNSGALPDITREEKKPAPAPTPQPEKKPASPDILKLAKLACKEFMGIAGSDAAKMKAIFWPEHANLEAAIKAGEGKIIFAKMLQSCETEFNISTEKHLAISTVLKAL